MPGMICYHLLTGTTRAWYAMLSPLSWYISSLGALLSFPSWHNTSLTCSSINSCPRTSQTWCAPLSSSSWYISSLAGPAIIPILEHPKSAVLTLIIILEHLKPGMLHYYPCPGKSQAWCSTLSSLSWNISSLGALLSFPTLETFKPDVLLHQFMTWNISSLASSDIFLVLEQLKPGMLCCHPHPGTSQAWHALISYSS